MRRLINLWCVCCTSTVLADSTVVFNEILYHPPGGNNSLQWIELYNQMAADVDLSGWKLQDGVSYTFTEGTVLRGGAYLLVAANVPAFIAATGITNVFGPFSGDLADGGERLRLVNHNDRRMDEITYGDEPPWPVGPDGSGCSLAKRQPLSGSAQPGNWSASEEIGGTPGEPNFPFTGGAGSPSGIPSVTFNEIAAATNAVFEVELVNHGNAPVNLDGLVLTATTSGAPDFLFPAQSLAPRDRLVLNEPQLAFQPQSGDRLFLYTTNKLRLVDAAVVKNRLRGRWPEGTGRWLHPSGVTFGTANQFDFHEEIVINEIMYHAPGTYGVSNIFAESPEQWVELFNRSSNTVDLTGWRLDGDIHFDFAPGTRMAPGEYLAVANDAAALQAAHPGLAVAGNFNGRLSRASSSIVLKDSADNPANEVEYFDGGRWPAWADGGGSSLELRDPRADNARAESWAASDESSRSEWRTYTYRGIAQNNPGYNVGYDIWKEFVLGLLDEGEVLLDDISVVESPSGTARQLIQNGSFESDAPGSMPVTWRIVGNHGLHGRTRVEADPANPGNRVLHLTSTGPTDVNHNHAETTLKSGSSYVTVVAGREYEISFRAKWLKGSRLLNTRLYFNWLQKTTVLDAPARAGTPGAPNSRLTANLGPTWSGFGHTPVIPFRTSNVVVTVTAFDPDGVASVTLRYAVNGGAWQSVPMSGQANGLYTGTVPGQFAGAVVQFHVEGQDSLGASSTFPANGAQSRALFVVEDGRANLNRLHNLRIIMTAADRDALYQATNRMSNHFLGATVVSDESEVFYDIGVRLKGSAWGRTHDSETGLHLQFQPDQLLRGVHGSISIERGGSKREVLANHLFNRAGRGVAAGYADVAWIVTPRTSDTGVGLLATTRTTDVFFREQYPGADDGSVYNYEVLYTPTSTVDGNAESVKLNFPYANAPNGGPDIQDLGNDQEAYRWNFQLRNNRDRDDYRPLLALAKAFELNGAELESRAEQVMDVDQWLRFYAVESLVGNDDFYTRLWNHNLRFYERSSDHRLVAIPWDLDRSFNLGANAPLWGTANTYGETNRFRKLIERPANLRRFYGHVRDLAATAFHSDYTARWAAHYSGLTGEDMNGRASYLNSRMAYALGQLPAQVPFVVTSINHGQSVVTNATFTVAGFGWIDVRDIRLAGSSEPLEVEWTGLDTWQVTLPSVLGTNLFFLEARDFDGALIGRQIFAVTSTGTFQPQRDYLRVTELMYHPAPPPAGSTNSAEEFEFIELRNIGPTLLDLTGVRFTNGITFDFSSSAVTQLAPGERVLLVANLAAFSTRYDLTGLKVAGEYPNRLSNAGERLDLADRHNLLIQSFSYSDGWYPLTDGAGFSLVILDDAGPLESWTDKSAWRVSGAIDGSPGAADPLPAFPRIVVNELLSRPALLDLDTIELFNGTTNDVDLGGWFLTDDCTQPTKYRIPPGTVIPAGGFRVFDESQFNAPGLPDGFALGAKGEEVFLYSGDATTNLTGYSHGFAFGAAAEGVSFGRLVTSTGDEEFPPQISTTLGAANAGPRLGPVVINEIHYHPATGGVEFVELKNITSSPVKLYDPARPVNTWRLGGLNFTFPANVELPAGGLLVLCEDDAASFRAAHQVPPEVPVLGPTGGNLQDSSESLDLMRPDEVPGTVTYLSVDQVRYNDRLPWPVAADGSGASLQRLNTSAYGNDPVNWTAAVPSPGVEFPGGTAPVIISQPVNHSVSAGADVLFTVTATGSAPIRYQWHYNGDALLGASNSVLSLRTVQPEQIGDYRVVVFNRAGAVASAPARLMVVIPPTILVPPADVAVRVGQSATFSVTAVSFGPLSYQWRFNGVDLAGQTAQTLTLDNVQFGQGGNYTVVVFDGSSSIESASARLSVLMDPVIIQPPLSQTVVAGGDVTVSVGIIGNPSPFGYIWRRGVVTLTNIVRDAPNCFFTLHNVQPSQGGPGVIYRVIITNAALPTLSVNATFNLTVLTDSDGDGLPDEWENSYGRDLNPSHDEDGDGLTNWEEYTAGTDATDVLRYLKLERVDAGPSTLEFVAVSNRTYTVQYEDVLATGRWTTLTNLPAQPTNRLEHVTDPVAVPHRFYRLVTPAQP